MKRFVVFALCPMAAFAAVDIPDRGVPTGCDARVMSDAYWKVWNEAEQKKIDADIEANRKADGTFFFACSAGYRGKGRADRP